MHYLLGSTGLFELTPKLTDASPAMRDILRAMGCLACFLVMPRLFPIFTCMAEVA